MRADYLAFSLIVFVESTLLSFFKHAISHSLYLKRSKKWARSTIKPCVFCARLCRFPKRTHLSMLIWNASPKQRTMETREHRACFAAPFAKLTGFINKTNGKVVWDSSSGPGVWMTICPQQEIPSKPGATNRPPEAHLRVLTIDRSISASCIP